MKKILSLIFALCVAVSSAFSMTASALAGTKIRKADNNFEFAKISAEIVYLYKNNKGTGNAEAYGETLRILGRTTDLNYNFRKHSAQACVLGADGRFMLQFNNYTAYKYALTSLRGDEKIIYAEPDTVVSVSSHEADGDGYLSWGVEALGLDKYSQYIAGNYDADGSDFSGVKVAIVDTGVQAIDPLKDRLVPGYDFVENDSDAYQDTSEDSHGTFLAGIVADCTQGTSVKIMPVRVLESKDAYLSIVVNGLYYAVDNGADVINLSLCVSVGPCSSLHDAAEYAEEKNVLFVASSGNFAKDTSNVCPAHIDSTISVSALNQNLGLASYSDFGDEIDFAAPGDGIVSYGADGNLKTLNGTSMSAAFISAGSALYLIENPTCTTSQVKYAFKSVCTDIGDKGADDKFGNGMPDFSKFIGNKYVPVTGIEFALGYVECALDSTYIPEFTVLPSDATNKSVTYSSSKPSVAYIVDGVICCVGLGVTSITVTTVDGGFAGSFAVFVREKVAEIPVPEKMYVANLPDKTEYVYKSGDELDLTGIGLTLVYSDGTNATTYNPDGIKATQISTDKAGKQTVTVEYEGFTGEFEITVVYTWWQTLIRILLLGFLWY